MATTRSSAGVKSLMLALDTLEEIAAAEGEIGISELAKRLGVAKGSIFRHLKTLVDRGYLLQNAQSSRYRLGIKTRLLGQLAADKADLSSVSQDIIKELCERIGQTVVISAVLEDSLTVLATQLAQSPVEIGVRPGSRLSLHASAQGKVVLAFSRRLSLDQLERRRLPRLTTHTLARWKTLVDEVALVRQR